MNAENFLGLDEIFPHQIFDEIDEFRAGKCMGFERTINGISHGNQFSSLQFPMVPTVDRINLCSKLNIDFLWNN